MFIYEDIDKYIRENYNNDDETLNYNCGYGDYIVYIDLNEKTLIGLDEDENDNHSEGCCGNS